VVPPAVDAQDLLIEEHALTELTGEPLGELMSTAAHPRLLSSADREHHAVQTAAGAQVEQHVECGVLMGLCRDDGGEHRRGEVAGRRIVAVLLEPLRRRHAVEDLGLRRVPRRVAVDAGGDPIDALDQRGERARRLGSQAERLVTAQRALAVGEQQ
jgi:hypothetical protein